MDRQKKNFNKTRCATLVSGRSAVGALVYQLKRKHCKYVPHTELVLWLWLRDKHISIEQSHNNYHTVLLVMYRDHEG